jgi:hypothetical protein
VNVEIADGMAWLEQFVKVTAVDSWRGISEKIGQEASSRRRSGMF